MLDDVEGNSALMLQKLKDNRTNSGAASAERKPQDTYLLDFESELSEALHDCVQHHQNLVTFSEMMEDFFNFFILMKSLQTTFQMCNIYFTIIKTNATLFQYFNLGSYIILSSLDLYQMCYFGEALKQQSSRIGSALFRCPWHLCGGRFRRDMLIILSNTTKPLVMTGGKFFVLDFGKLTGVSAMSSVRLHHSLLRNSIMILISDFEGIIFIFHSVAKIGRLMFLLGIWTYFIPSHRIV